MRADLDWLGLLETETARFAAVLDGVDPNTRVPSCPDWTAADLRWHLAQTQWFWAVVVGKRLTTDAELEAEPDLERPIDAAGLRDVSHLAFRELHVALAQTPPDTPCWTWSTEQTVGFVRMRQPHEVLIHRVDAELTAVDRSPIDPAFAADGVTEVLTLMYAEGTPAGPDDPVVALVATDTGARWRVRPGEVHLTLLDPEGYADAEIAGTAADLDCWLWNRPPVGEITRQGDPEALARFDAVLAVGVH